MPTIVLIGSGAREHAIGAACRRSSQEIELAVLGATRNPALRNLAAEYVVTSHFQPDEVVTFAQKSKADFAIIGPEAPLAAGVVDALQEAGIPAVGPTAAAARIESSKSFARELLQEDSIPVYPAFAVITKESQLDAWLAERKGEFVVKPDGLTGGKGVKVQGDHFVTREEGKAYALDCLSKNGRVVVEEKLVGQEFSLMSFSDGTHARHMPVVQDNKRLREGDAGPNTGGMGSVSDANHRLPFLTQTDIELAQKTNERVIQSLYARGLAYKGILYGNFMAVADGIRLIEYNARFGDPEAINVLSILESDFVEICQAIIGGTLDAHRTQFARQATVCKYLVPAGYPDTPVKGEKIDVSRVDQQKIDLFYAAVDERADGLYLTGSRAIGIVGVADTITEAEKKVEEEIQKVRGSVTHRADIGTPALLTARTSAMRELRKVPSRAR